MSANEASKSDADEEDKVNNLGEILQGTGGDDEGAIEGPRVVVNRTKLVQPTVNELTCSEARTFLGSSRALSLPRRSTCLRHELGLYA